MLFEATTLTAAARVIAETLEKNYATDPVPIFAAADLDTAQLAVAGARYPWNNMQTLWRAAVEATGDPSFGLYAGRNIRPTSFHALGYAWLASETLLGSLERLCRYFRVVSTAPLALDLTRENHGYLLTETLTDPSHVPTDTAIDAFVVAIIQLCRTASTDRFAPRSVELQRKNHGNAAVYADVLGCPVSFGAADTRILFDRDSLEARLPGENADVARANDKVAEHYLASLEPHQVASEVRELLIDLLPSGGSSQSAIAGRMNRSLSTLQRQLQ
ncbi:MAG: AraC family transcriptional regulator, partial [Gammaproteobacteria bacterium]|nr:AraC family transcriptional regulator [Gammaproteobacteria bacterium]